MPKTTRDRCITPSFSPSTYHRGKLMDGELRYLTMIRRATAPILQEAARPPKISAAVTKRMLDGSLKKPEFPRKSGRIAKSRYEQSKVTCSSTAAPSTRRKQEPIRASVRRMHLPQMLERSQPPHCQHFWVDSDPAIPVRRY